MQWMHHGHGACVEGEQRKEYGSKNSKRGNERTRVSRIKMSMPA